MLFIVGAGWYFLIDLQRYLKERAKATSGMRYAAILLHQYATEAFADTPGKISTDHCIVFHVHRQHSECTPSTYRRDYRNIQAVCRNIARSWEAIDPPQTFDSHFAWYRH